MNGLVSIIIFTHHSLLVAAAYLEHRACAGLCHFIKVNFLLRLYIIIIIIGESILHAADYAKILCHFAPSCFHSGTYEYKQKKIIIAACRM